MVLTIEIYVILREEKVLLSLWGRLFRQFSRKMQKIKFLLLKEAFLNLYHK